MPARLSQRVPEAVLRFKGVFQGIPPHVGVLVQELVARVGEAERGAEDHLDNALVFHPAGSERLLTWQQRNRPWDLSASGRMQ